MALDFFCLNTLLFLSFHKCHTIIAAIIVFFFLVSDFGPETMRHHQDLTMKLDAATAISRGHLSTVACHSSSAKEHPEIDVQLPLGLGRKTSRQHCEANLCR
ncbi:hypothetical protein BRADI_1g10945v3 [Brachypodium distachyon]|uniref:Uncharacterized protein n=1 Tax=Brachypodium distachyon TaxID=15368 RepID=A0A0Q3JNK2_BRADI|nr:hypothetical protein BRADI_1g10945v3 [Brachypodium distachyon]